MKSFETLFAELTEKAAASPEISNTAKLVELGVHAIGKKIVEEAAEVWMACEFQTREQAAEEIAQLIYHLQVMMVTKGITLEEVENYL